MKKNTFILTLVLLALAFQWSCMPETATPDDGNITPRHHRDGHGGGGGGNGGGDEESPLIYAVQYTGPLFTSDVAYLEVTADTKKKIDLHSLCDATAPTTLNNLYDFFTDLDPASDCYDDTECSFAVTLNQWDKFKYGHRVRAIFWFEDPALPDGLVRLIMYGTLDGDFPPTTPDITTIEFDKVHVGYGTGNNNGDPECAVPNDSLSIYGQANQFMTVALLETTNVDSLCATKPGCIN